MEWKECLGEWSVSCLKDMQKIMDAKDGEVVFVYRKTLRKLATDDPRYTAIFDIFTKEYKVKEKLSKELAEEIKEKIKWVGTGYEYESVLNDVRKIIDSFTEKTPEEELAEYKCPACGSFSFKPMSLGAMCQECQNYIQHRFGTISSNACYQPDWNGGKV